MSKQKAKKKNTSASPTSKTPLQTTSASAKTPAQAWKPSTWFWIHLGIIAVFLFVLRINLLDLPLERDESAYAYLGQRAAEGLSPYRDFYEMKPPFLFYGYSLLNLIFGYSMEGLRWGALFLSFVMCIGVYLIGRSFFGAKYGLLAALILALLSANPYASMVFAESELLVMAIALYGIWLLCRLLTETPSSKLERWWLIGAGLLIGSAVMIKQSAVFFLGFAAVILVLLAEGDDLKSRVVKLIQKGLWFSLGATTPVLICLAIIFGFGVWEEFAFWNLEYPTLYTEENQDSTVNLFQINFNNIIQHQVLLWVLAALGLLAIVLKGLGRKLSIAFLALVLFSFLTITPGQRYYLHYWIQFLPAVSLLWAHLFFKLEKMGENPALSFAKAGSLPLAFLFLLIGVALSSTHWLKTDSASLMRNMFGGNPFVEDQLMARIIESQIQPNETVVVLGAEPQIYVYLNKKAPSRHFYTAFLSRNHRFSQGWQDEALEALKTKKPDYVVFNIVPMSWMLRENSNQGFYQSSYNWALNNYTPIAWADYVDYYNPTIVSDAAASTYKPQGGSYVILLKKK